MKHISQSSSQLPNDSRLDASLRQAQRLIDAGQPDQALKVLGRSKLTTDEVRNARGVCLLRLGRIDDALQQFRTLTLAPGCTWMKPGLPAIYQVNFATTLLISGRRAGCLSALYEIDDQSHPSVLRLRGAIERWQRSLSWSQWLLWKIGVEPSLPVALDFPPGELIDPSSAPDTTPPMRRSSELAA